MNYSIHDLCKQQSLNSQRVPDPNTILVPFGYEVEVFFQGLNTPTGLAFDENGNLLVADSGTATNNPQVLRIINGNIEVIAENFNPPISGINMINGELYVSHRSFISVIGADGSRRDIISGPPSFGDFINNRVELGPDRRIYFGQGTATNSGVVGLDNSWIFEFPYFNDIPGSPIIIRGINYETENALIPAEQAAVTGAFLHYDSKAVQRYSLIVGDTKASGSVLSANLDGSDLFMEAWGLRNPVTVKFNLSNQLIISNQCMADRGSRPVGNAPDTLDRLVPGGWYGWPDYVAGIPVSSPQYIPSSGLQPEMLLENIPSIPQRPIATFSPGSNVAGFDINNNPDFGPIGDIYIASFGRTYFESSMDYIRSGVGHRINRVDGQTGEVTTFSLNRSGFPEPGGFGRPVDVLFGPDGAMYISDLAYDTFEEPNIYQPGDGVIWRISRI